MDQKVIILGKNLNQKYEMSVFISFGFDIILHLSQKNV
jgi:hypothetical protein